MTESSDDEEMINEACEFANTLVAKLADLGCINPRQRSLADALKTATCTLVELSSEYPVNNAQVVARVEMLGSATAAALAQAIELGADGYDLSDVRARLEVAWKLVSVMDNVVAAPLLSNAALDWLSDEMHEQLTPLLRLVVRLMDPDKFEFGYVTDDSVQAGCTAMNVAAHLSRVIACADAKAREAGAMGDLAA